MAELKCPECDCACEVCTNSIIRAERAECFLEEEQKTLALYEELARRYGYTGSLLDSEDPWTWLERQLAERREALQQAGLWKEIAERSKSIGAEAWADAHDERCREVEELKEQVERLQESRRKMSVTLLSRIRDLIAAGRDLTEAAERGGRKAGPGRRPVRQCDEVMSWANAVIRMRRELERVGLAKAMDGIEWEGGD